MDGGDRTALRGDSQRQGAEFADLKSSGEEERGSGRPDREIEGVRTQRKASSLEPTGGSGGDGPSSRRLGL
jgi:hypothetical protein